MQYALCSTCSAHMSFCGSGLALCQPENTPGYLAITHQQASEEARSEFNVM